MVPINDNKIILWEQLVIFFNNQTMQFDSPVTSDEGVLLILH